MAWGKRDKSEKDDQVNLGTKSVGCDCELPNPKDRSDECTCTNSTQISRGASTPASFICSDCQGGRHRWSRW